jgi:hypothetical protein
LAGAAPAPAAAAAAGGQQQPESPGASLGNMGLSG